MARIKLTIDNLFPKDTQDISGKDLLRLAKDLGFDIKKQNRRDNRSVFDVTFTHSGENVHVPISTEQSYTFRANDVRNDIQIAFKKAADYLEEHPDLKRETQEEPQIDIEAQRQEQGLDTPGDITSARNRAAEKFAEKYGKRGGEIQR